MNGATTIQERLKDLRLNKGLKLEELAEQTGISKSALGSYEKDDYIEVGIDLECTILPDDQLVEPDDGKSTPQAVNDIIDDLIWRIEFVVWADDLCQCVNREILFVVQNEICQKQVALVRFNIFSGQCPFGADDLHAAKEIDMDVLRIVFGGLCCCQQGLLLFDFVEFHNHCIGSDE